jgi:hypothetical protein
MPEYLEYKVISDPQNEQLEKKLNQLADTGFRPIFMSSAATPHGVFTTVILEHTVTVSRA